MKSILRRLFDGEISPSEHAAPRTGLYRKLLTDEKNAKDILREMLTREQYNQGKLLVNIKDEIAYQQYACIYGEGVRFGVQLMVEVFDADEDTPQFPSWLKTEE